ncbi:MAG: hypothetical protein AAF960_25720 [Bacteroidota bacterium]
MTTASQKNSMALVYGLPLLLVLGCYSLVQLPVYQNNTDSLSLGITLDLVITLPLIYFFLIWKKDIPKITVASVFVLGLVAATYILPPNQQDLLSMIKLVAFPVVEAGVLTYVGFTLFKTYRAYQSEKQQTPDFLDALFEATDKILPTKISRLFATEIAVVYYTFFGWSEKTTKADEFTYHRTSGIQSVMYAIMGLAVVEIGVTHLLLERWNPTVALVASFVGVYSCLQMSALLRSMKQRFIKILKEDKELILKYGFAGEARIPFSAIDRIEMTRRSLPAAQEMVQFSPLGLLDTHNLILFLNEPLEMYGFYGIKKTFRTLAIYVDEKERFCERLRALMVN